MLVLTRKPGEKIVIPGLDLEIQVLKIGSRQVKIGITAPPDVVVYREEVLRQLIARSPLNEKIPVVLGRDCGSG